MVLRILYALGPGDVCTSFEHWELGVELPSQTSITFSSQFFEFCSRHSIVSWCVSSHQSKRRIVRPHITVENAPKPMASSAGGRYHLQQVLYCFQLFARAVRLRANLVIVDSGTTHWFALTIFRLLGIKVVAVMHNTLWPAGHYPQGGVRRLVCRLDGWFLRNFVLGVVAVSPECERQANKAAGVLIPCIQFRPQFFSHGFAAIPQARHNARPFRVLFVGRCEVYKGVIDLLEIVEQVQKAAPGQVAFDVCGEGSASGQLVETVKRRGLGGIVEYRGQLPREQLLECYSRSHVVIIPTRSDFVEGFAMVAAEAILARRPVITSRLVPALEVLRPACIEVEPEDTGAFAARIVDLLRNRVLYEQLSLGCSSLASQFTDGKCGLGAALEQLLKEVLAPQSS